MTIDGIIANWNKKNYQSIYWIEGEEDYYIDKLVHYAEQNILSESETSFNLTVFYGRDAQWTDILNACKKYPMFSDRQVVIVKEAQHLKEIDKLESYIKNPLPSTLLMIAFKDKKLDARTKFAKLVKDKTEYVLAKKIYDSALPEWVTAYVSAAGRTITPGANALLVDHIGNDLSRIKNEIDKIGINLGKRKSITEEDVQNYVGISKEFNIFELQAAMAAKNLPKAIRIIQYFEANPKTAPIQLVLPSLFSFFSKVYMIFGAAGNDDAIAKQIGIAPYFSKNYLQASKTYGFRNVEHILLLLHRYNLKSIGIQSVKTDDAELLKEMIAKIMI